MIFFKPFERISRRREKLLLAMQQNDTLHFGFANFAGGIR